MNGNKTLSIDGLVSNSSDLNKVSTDLNDICTELYSTIQNLKDGGYFISVTASNSYFESIDSLNQMVPKFTEAILKFSKFLSDYVLQNYSDVDEEMRNKIENNLAESLSKLEALGLGSSSGAGVDYTKIASTAQGALNGDFIDSDKIHKEYFEGELEFVTRDDGSIVITKNGTPIGFTTQDGINGATAALGVTSLVDNITSSSETESLSASMTQEDITKSAGSVASSTEAISTSSGSIPSGGHAASSTGISAGYTGSVHTKSQASSGIKESSGTITTGHQSYTIVPDSQYQKAPGTISESDYNLLVAQVAGESGNSKDDMLGVATTVLNRLEKDGNFGSSVSEVLQNGYFPWGESYRAYVESGKSYAGGQVATGNGRYASTEWGQEKLAQVKEVVDDALGGVRNLEENVYYYSGNGEYNRFSDVL